VLPRLEPEPFAGHRSFDVAAELLDEKACSIAFAMIEPVVAT
jgi:hypothetical protein